MALIDKIKEAHKEGLTRYQNDRILLNSPVFWLVSAINDVMPGTVDNVPAKPHPLATLYRPQVEYVKGFYEHIKK